MTDIARLGMDIDSSGLRDGQRELQNLVGEGARAEGAIEGQSRRTAASWGRMAARAGMAVAAIGTGITLAVRGQLNDIDRLAKDAQRLALPVDMLSQMQHAAELSGASIEGMQRGLRNVSRTMVNNGERFEELGIAIRGVDGEMRPVIDVFEDAADRIAAMEDGADKTALAMQLFGERAGPELIPMLNQGRDGIRDMREEADRLGLTISGDTAAAAQAFNDNITRLTGAGRGFWRMISADLAPTLERFSGVVVDLVGRLGEMSPRMRSMFSNGALVLAVLTPLVAVVGAFAAAIALIGAPALAVAAGIAAITAAAIAFWPEIKAAGQAVYGFADSIGAIDAVKIFFEGMMEQGRNFIDLFRAIFTADLPEILNSLTAIFQQPMQTITALWESDFAMPLREIMAGVGANIQETFNGLVTYFQELPGRFLQFGRDIIMGLWQGLQDAWNEFSITDMVTGWAGGIRDSFAGMLGIRSPSQVFQEFGMNIGQGLANGISEGMGLAQRAMSAVAGALTSDASGMVSSVLGSLGQMFQGSKPIAAAQALINTFQGMTEALKLPFPGNLAAAAAVAAQGFAAVRGIQSARPGSSGGGGAVSAATPGAGASGGGQNIHLNVQPNARGDIPMETFRGVVDSINDQLSRGGRIVA